MPNINWGSAFIGAIVGLLIYHFMKSRVSAMG